MEEDSDTATKQTTFRKKQKDTFNEDLSKILFAFGDSKEPREETVKALEEYMLFFLDKLITKIKDRNMTLSTKHSSSQQSLKVTKEDVIYAFRNDSKWLARIAYIIKRKNEIDRINKKTRPNEEAFMIMKGDNK